MTKFQEGLHVECGKCGEYASQHRLTPSGNFYCLKFNASHRWRRDSSRRDILVYTVSVKELVKGSFPAGLGKAINGALGGFVDTPLIRGTN